MKALKVIVFSVAAACLLFSATLAADAKKGKALFNDPKLGASGKSCNSCHADGRVLDGTGKREFIIMDRQSKSLEAAVNACIETAMKGKALDPKSDDMENITEYVKALKAKIPAARPKKREAAAY